MRVVSRSSGAFPAKTQIKQNKSRPAVYPGAQRLDTKAFPGMQPGGNAVTAGSPREYSSISHNWRRAVFKANDTSSVVPKVCV